MNILYTCARMADSIRRHGVTTGCLIKKTECQKCVALNKIIVSEFFLFFFFLVYTKMQFFTNFLEIIFSRSTKMNSQVQEKASVHK